jgi:hypothetical protein
MALLQDEASGHERLTNMKPRVLVAAVLVVTGGLYAQQFSPPAHLTLPVGGGALAIVDLDKDGKPDILTARGDEVTVYLGDGRGNFAQAAGSPFPAGMSPSDFALGDFNEDGRLDVAIPNHETDYSTLLLGDGRGALAPASPSRISVPSLPHPHGMAAGDFNGDRHLDLAVESWEENTVLVLHGNGRAGFAGRPARLAVGPKPYWKLRVGDLNNDGKDDLVTTNTDGSSVSVLCSDRSNALQQAKLLAVSRSPFAVAIGDVNGDRFPDLAVAHRWGGVDPKLDAVTVLTGRGDCDFAPSPESPLKAGTSPTAIAVGDFDGDSIGDVVVANFGSDNVTVFLGGRSGLRPARGSPFAVGKGPVGIAVGDLNGDRKADIVTGNGGSGDATVVISP